MAPPTQTTGPWEVGLPAPAAARLRTLLDVVREETGQEPEQWLDRGCRSPKQRENQLRRTYAALGRLPRKIRINHFLAHTEWMQDAVYEFIAGTCDQKTRGLTIMCARCWCNYGFVDLLLITLLRAVLVYHDGLGQHLGPEYLH